MCNLRQSFQSVSSIFPAFHSRNVLLLPAIITSHIQTAVYFLPVSLLRSFIYIGLMMWRGISLWQRIVQTQVRRYLAATAALCVFWLSIRTVKFFFAATPAASVFWALPVSTQWHIHSECLSSNTNKKACSNSTFCREQKRAALPKNPRKIGSKSRG